MKNKQLHKSLCYLVLTLLLLIVTVMSGGFTVPAFAETKGYTEVINDLSKDKNFSTLKYPVIPGNYSPQVIQIAESTDGELFIYVYHPCGQTSRYKATSINISTTLGASLKYENYDLQLLNSSGTLYKYKVSGLKVQSAAVRCYDISSIYRKWDNAVDGTPANDNTKSEKAFPVGQCWTVATVKDEVIYDYQDVEVVEVEQHVGFRRYPNGINPLTLSGSACDAHYLMFSTQTQIDRLLSADVSFVTQPYTISKGSTTLGGTKPQFRTLYSDEYAENASGGWFGKKAKWDRIVSTEEFLACGLEFTDEEIKTYNQFQWVLNFYETELTLDKNGANPLLLPIVAFGDMIQYWAHNSDPSYLYDISSEYVSEVTLLRLEFERDGEVFNLGVVSDKQTGSGKPSNPNSNNGIADIPWWVWLIVILAVVAVVLIVLLIFFPAVAKAIFAVIWKIISAPFKALKKLNDNLQKKNEEKARQKSKSGKKKGKKRRK